MKYSVRVHFDTTSVYLGDMSNEDFDRVIDDFQTRSILETDKHFIDMGKVTHISFHPEKEAF